MDNWTIVKGVSSPRGRLRIHQLHPRSGQLAQDLKFHGYNTGITGVQEAAAAADTPYLDMIFFTDAQLATMHAQEMNSAFDREVEIFQKMKAAAGG